MNAPNFTSALDRPAHTIKPPPAYPIGTYLCMVDGVPTPGQSKQKQTDYREMAFKILQPQADVDQAALTEFTGGIQGKVIKGMSTRFYITDDAIWRYVEFLRDILGIDPGSEANPRGAKEMEAEAPGKQLYVTLRHTPAQDGKRMFHEVAGYARV